jgi:hypothetical protein
VFPDREKGFAGLCLTLCVEEDFSWGPPLESSLFLEEQRSLREDQVFEQIAPGFLASLDSLCDVLSGSAWEVCLLRLPCWFGHLGP